MTTEQIAILALIQGITEFLPISSSAHLVLAPLFLGWQDQGLVFDVALHVGTLFAVLLYFFQQTKTIIQGSLHILSMRFTTTQAQFCGLLIMATLPVAIAGLLFADFIAHHTRSFQVIGMTSILFGALLWLSDLSSSWHHNLKKLTWLHALSFGLFQALAIIPGTSRSGITMTAGRLMGFSRKDAAAFSMLMAIPVLALSGVHSALDGFGETINWSTALPELLLGIGLSFLTALLAIAIFMRLITHIGFGVFAFYRIMLGAALLLLA